MKRSKHIVTKKKTAGKIGVEINKRKNKNHIKQKGNQVDCGQPCRT